MDQHVRDELSKGSLLGRQGRNGGRDRSFRREQLIRKQEVNLCLTEASTKEDKDGKGPMT